MLSVLRDFRATAPVRFVREVFPSVTLVMQNSAMYDEDGDGLIENSGFPDQVKVLSSDNSILRKINVTLL